MSATPAAELIRLAWERGGRIAVAESLTGGRLSDAIVSVPGASAAFSGAIVAYDTALKQRLLGVDGELLRRRGPVDPEVAKQMASGVRRACAVPGDGAGVEVARPRVAPAMLGIATTGVAGPDPDPQTGQGAGTVWVGVSLADSSVATGERAWAVRLPVVQGSREQVRVATVTQAVRLGVAALRGDFAELE